MRPSVRACVLGVVVGACASPEPVARVENAVTSSALPAAPAGYLLAASGTHVEECVGTKCSTMWSDDEDDSPNNCGGGFAPSQSFIIHQRGADWDGIPGEAELHGHEYRLASQLTSGTEPPGTVRTMHNQSVIIQCCPAVPSRPTAFFAMKVCPDPCDAADGLCPVTLADRTSTLRFGTCRTTPVVWQLTTDRCDLRVVEAGWRDPHAPHDLAKPSGDDKRVFHIVYRAAWTCGDGFCDSDEDASCPDCSTQ